MTKKTKKQKKDNNLQPRPPVVVILGHVDHGKTSLIEKIKEMKILEKESGGITQHIGAYEIEHNEQKITFIDTPGHEAFDSMRSRGASVADIAILVVAADEGVKTQTKEAITHIKKAGLPFIVALNKIDKPTANVEMVKRELLQNKVEVESMGGKVPLVEVSAETGQGIKDFLELILLVAEIEELKGDLTQPAQGVIIEAYLDNQRGPTATFLVRNGILKKDDIIGTPSSTGKAKVLEDFMGESINKALPSMPATVIGLIEVPRTGETFQVYSSLELAETNLEKQKSKREFGEILFVEPTQKVLNIILKADVLGSIEAIQGVLTNLPQEKVILRILKKGIGEISESDVKLARSAKAKIIGFRVKIGSQIAHLANRQKIKVMNFEVIYELTQAVRQLMQKTIDFKVVRQDIGKVKVLVLFRTEKRRQIIGGKVFEGEIRKGTRIEVRRLVGEEEKVIGKGKLITLQRNKKEAEKLVKGEECGLLYESDAKVQEGDIMIFYIEEQEREDI